jgi:hypothetical protein
MATPSSRFVNERASFPFGTWLGVILLFIFFGLLVAVLVRLVPRGNTYEAKRATAREEKLKTALHQAHKELTTYAWVDKTKGVARIPIERAMELTLATLSQKKPEPAGPIATPTPSVAPAASAAPPASPSPSASPTKATAVSGSKSENAGQPAAASNPPNAAPGTQPGASATPAAAPPPPSGKPPVSPSTTPMQGSAGTPLPVAGKTPPPSPSP